MICRNCGTSNNDDAKFCTKCGETFDSKQINKPLGMKWFKFIIYIQLIIAFLLNLYSAYRLYSGEIYFDGTRYLVDQVYTAFPALRYIDMIFMIVSIGMAVLSIFVRQKLVKYRTNAVKLYLSFLILNGLISLLYCGATSLATGINTFDVNVLRTVVQNLFLFFYSNDYFRKRKHLFVN